MSTTTKKQSLYPPHLVIGFGILALFWLLPPIDPITPLGMRCVGAFLCMVYLWSTVETMWPSLVGLFVLAISGYGGDGGFNGVWMNAIGADTVLLTLFAMVLMGGLDVIGDTQYITRWFLTRKIFKGRPIVFLATYYALCFVLAAVTQPMISLLLLWPISTSLMETLGIKKGERIWKYFFMGMFAVSTLAQPLFPFKGAELIPYAAFQKMTASMGNPMSIPMLSYMIVCFTVTVIFTAIYLFLVKFVLRVDLSKLKAIDPAMLERYIQLPPMNKRQVIYLIMLPCFLLMILVPSVVKGKSSARP